jgi:hypothetical protein
VKCKWHKCRTKFQPDHHLQRFCSTACQQERAAWRSVRGAKLVDLVLDDDIAGIAKVRAALINETLKGE